MEVTPPTPPGNFLQRRRGWGLGAGLREGHLAKMAAVTSGAAVLLLLTPAAASHAWYEFPQGNRTGPSSGSSPTTFEAMSSTLVWDRVDEGPHTFVYAATQFYFVRPSLPPMVPANEDL